MVAFDSTSLKIDKVRQGQGYTPTVAAMLELMSRGEECHNSLRDLKRQRDHIERQLSQASESAVGWSSGSLKIHFDRLNVMVSQINIRISEVETDATKVAQAIASLETGEVEAAVDCLKNMAASARNHTLSDDELIHNQRTIAVGYEELADLLRSSPHVVG